MRVLIVSGVRHARDYVPLLRSLPGIEVVGCADTPDSPFAEDDAALASATGIPLLDLDQGLASCDIALVCSEPTRHVDLAVRALEAGRHVLVDKPAATDTRGAQRLWEAADRAPGLLTSVHRLYSPQLVRARRIVDSGAIGLPLAVDAEWLAAGGLDGTTVERPELVCDPALSGGGELMNFGWYPALAIRHLTGLEVEEVVAFSSAAPHAPLFAGPHGAYGVEDAAVLSLRLRNGVVATATVARTPAGVGPAPVSSNLRARPRLVQSARARLARPRARRRGRPLGHRARGQRRPHLAPGRRARRGDGAAAAVHRVLRRHPPRTHAVG
ncbi:Gfo/Idh/MocA family protein, partial [Streptomyces sp. NRRL WC-3549]|uniref:Gfo/Idh/MocA family protein n=1 Tax=Streptomyces sp. NRRL WC-3549 TaxID=1463925 RepID=UPI001F1ED7E6